MYILIFIYTALLLTGSLVGYFKAGSTPSLIMGVLSTLLLTLLTLLYRRGSKLAGSGLLLIVLALDAFFSWRFIKTLSLFPAGFFSLFSTILLIVISLRFKKKAH